MVPDVHGRPCNRRPDEPHLRPRRGLGLRPPGLQLRQHRAGAEPEDPQLRLDTAASNALRIPACGPEQLPPGRRERPDARRLGPVPQGQHEPPDVWALGSCSGRDHLLRLVLTCLFHRRPARSPRSELDRSMAHRSRFDGSSGGDLVLAPRMVSARTPPAARCRGGGVLREEGPAGAGGQLLHLPLGRHQLQGRPAVIRPQRPAPGGRPAGRPSSPASPRRACSSRPCATRKGSPKMPPKKRLSAEQIADLTTWIKDGAAWPGRRHGRSPRQAEREVREAAQVPLGLAASGAGTRPLVRDESWPADDIDRFILASWSKRGSGRSATPTSRP